MTNFDGFMRSCWTPAASENPFPKYHMRHSLYYMRHVIDKSNPRTSPFVFKFGLTCINCKLCNNRLKLCVLGRTWKHVDMTTFMFISKELFTDHFIYIK